ncbi:MAG: Na/Pi cotransporter family protein [Peptoniphilaceae bacterium]|nr:Na/Pi cotransporter family protein [Peptoniphilaceae bacterium]MDY6018067.1 Na/Pi cotransporter family protein [Anaerococcus sp.]
MDQMSLTSLQWNLIAGGLAIFLLGISIMGDSLTNFAGPKLRGYIERYTSTPLKGILVGVFITGVIQSSSATTVIAISFVRAGIMSLEQSMGIILGANIGTTVTAILIGFNLELLSYYICLIGVFITLFAKKKRIQYIGNIIVGFGLLFIGLQMMGESLKDLKNLPGFNDVVSKIATNPLIGVLVGTLITAIIQSSSAFIGIIQTLFAASAINLNVALALMFGANIGTCITSLLASIGGSLAAKRTAIFHVFFNVTIATLFMIILIPYEAFVSMLTDLLGANPMMTIAIGHFTFNFVGMLIFTPLLKPTSKLLAKLVPGKESMFSDIQQVELQEHLIRSFPASALDQAKLAIINESDIALQTLKSSQLYLTTGDSIHFQNLNQAEDIVNRMDTNIEKYLLEISQQDLAPELDTEFQTYLLVQKNIERISDLGQNLGEYYEEIFNSNEKYVDEAVDDLTKIYELVIHNFINAMEVFKTKDINLFDVLTEDENNLDLLEHELRHSHYARLTSGVGGDTIASSLFVDIVSTFERIGDHAYNIARSTLDPIKVH